MSETQPFKADPERRLYPGQVLLYYIHGTKIQPVEVFLLSMKRIGHSIHGNITGKRQPNYKLFQYHYVKVSYLYNEHIETVVIIDYQIKHLFLALT